MSFSSMAPGMTGGNATLSAISQIAGGIAANRAAKQNAKQLEAQAASAQAAASFQARDLQRQVRQLAGQQRAGFAKAGVALDEGSPLAVTSETAGRGAVDVSNAYLQGDLQARNLKYQAGIERFSGKLRRNQAIASGFGTLLQGAARAATLSA